MNLQHERLAQLCAELRFGGVAVDYAAEAQRAAEAEATYPDFLEAVLRAELETRRARARQMLARVAGFPAIKTLDQYDFEFATGAPRQMSAFRKSLAPGWRPRWARGSECAWRTNMSPLLSRADVGWPTRPAPVLLAAADRSSRLALPATFGHHRAPRRRRTMQEMPRSRFPEGSLLAAMLRQHAPIDVRRAAQRLRAEGAPALAIDGGVAGLASGLASSDVSRSPAVLDVLPPLFWLEAQREDGPGTRGLSGWILEKKPGGLAVRGFSIAFGHESAPEPEGTATLPFGADAQKEDEETRYVRGLVIAVSLPEMLSEMGESSPVVLMPADASDRDARFLRGFRLSVAVSPDSAPI